MLPAIINGFIILGVKIVELDTENIIEKCKTGDYDQKWLEENRENLLKGKWQKNLIITRV